MTDEELKALVAGLAVAQKVTHEQIKLNAIAQKATDDQMKCTDEQMKFTDERLKRTDEKLERMGIT